MLEEILNQPIRFTDPIEAESCNLDCGTDTSQCLLLDKYRGDWISFQMKNKFTNLLDQLGMCDLELIYSNTLDGAGSGDIFSPSGMTWDPGGSKFDKAPGASSALFSTSYSMVAGVTYKIRALISNYVSGNVRFSDIGSIHSPYFSGDGWHEFVWTAPATNRMTIAGDSTSQFSVDEFEILELAGQSLLGTGWSPVDSDFPGAACGFKFCHTPGALNIDPMVSSMFLVVGKRYRINIRISGMTAGTLTLSGGSYSESLDRNGYYTRWITPTSSGLLQFIPDTDFDGCFEILEFGEQATQHTVALFDKNDVFVQILSGGQCIRDAFSFFLLLEDLPFLPVGCYKVCVFDADTRYSQDADIAMGALEFYYDPGWTLVDGISVSYTYPGQMNIKDGGSASTFLSNLFVSDTCMIMEVKFRNYPDINALADQVTIWMDGFLLWSVPAISPANAGVFQIPFTVHAGGIGIPPYVAGNIQILSEYGVGTDLELEYIRFFVDPACGDLASGNADYCSQCIFISDSTLCEKQLSAQMDFGTDPQGNTMFRYAFGFQWDGVFFPMFRATSDFHMSKYPTDADGYIYADGDHRGTEAMLEKKWDFAISSLTEGDMDAIRMMVRADSFNVYTTDVSDPLGGFAYYCPSREVAGAWPKKEKPGTADMEVELQRRFKEALFYRNSF